MFKTPKKNKILIVLPYYDRPQIVLNALNSVIIANEYYDNWHLAIIDDGSKSPIKPIAEDVLRDVLDKVSFYNTECSVEDKLNNRGLLGKFINQAVNDIPADIELCLPDDDALYHDYLLNLNKYMNDNPNVEACYSNVLIYNPIKEPPQDSLDRMIGFWNKRKESIDRLSGVLDICQIAVRSIIHKKYSLWCGESDTLDVDWKMGRRAEKSKLIVEYTGFISQYKGIHDNQLSVRAKVNEQYQNGEWVLDFDMDEAFNETRIDK